MSAFTGVSSKWHLFALFTAVKINIFSIGDLDGQSDRLLLVGESLPRGWPSCPDQRLRAEGHERRARPTKVPHLPHQRPRTETVPGWNCVQYPVIPMNLDQSFLTIQTCRGRVAQSVERPKGPILVRLYWRGFESRSRHRS